MDKISLAAHGGDAPLDVGALLWSAAAEPFGSRRFFQCSEPALLDGADDGRDGRELGSGIAMAGGAIQRVPQRI